MHDLQNARGATLINTQRRVLIPLAIVVIGVGLDQLTKSLAVAHLEPGSSRPLVGSLLQLTLIRNPGAAFSTGTGMTFALSLIALIAAFVVAWFLIVKVKDIWWAIALGLLEAGVIGNLIDRILREPGPMRGHVVDFLELPNWPVFNLADCCISVAAVLIVIQAGRGVNLDGSRERDRIAENSAEGKSDDERE